MGQAGQFFPLQAHAVGRGASVSSVVRTSPHVWTHSHPEDPRAEETGRRVAEMALRGAGVDTGLVFSAVERLERFVREFEALTPSEVPGLGAWTAWVGARANEGWQDRLHFTTLLENFGCAALLPPAAPAAPASAADASPAHAPCRTGRFTAEFATALRTAEHEEVQKDGSVKRESHERYSFRWLSKALTGWRRAHARTLQQPYRARCS